MSGINHLYDIYRKKGDDFLNELFNSKVTVNEKMDGSTFTFEKSPSNKFIFFKRNQRRPITMVDRVLMKYYENPIQYIESLPVHVVERIPSGWRFGTEYFNSTQPQNIVYDELPKNNLILSYIQKRDANGNVTETVQDKEQLDIWAEILGISKPPIIFQGNLNDEQKTKILEFVNTPLADLYSEFSTKSFVKYILGVLNPSLDRTTLNQDLEKPIEGIVFRFGDGNDQLVAKMIDPVFAEIAKSKNPTETPKKQNDILSIVVLDVMNFILSKGIKSFDVSGNTEDERYINFISDVFVKFLEKYSSRYQGMEFNEPDHLKKDEFKVNNTFLKSRAARKWLEEDESFESLFKLIMNSFRKIRKKPGGIVNSDMLNQFNMLVKDIESYVQVPEKKIMESENDFTDFLSFKKKYIVEKVDYLTEEGEIEDEFTTSDEFIDAIESKDPEKESVVSIEPEKDSSDVNLYIGSFQPFDNLDIKNLESLKKEGDRKAIVCIIHPGYDYEGEYPLSLETVNQTLDSAKNNTDLIEGVISNKKLLLSNILEKCYEKGYNPSFIGSDDNNAVDLQKQLDYFTKTFKSDGNKTSPKIFDVKSKSRSKELLPLIKNGEYTLFKKLVPDFIHTQYFEKFKQELDKEKE